MLSAGNSRPVNGVSRVIRACLCRAGPVYARESDGTNPLLAQTGLPRTRRAGVRRGHSPCERGALAHIRARRAVSDTSAPAPVIRQGWLAEVTASQPEQGPADHPDSSDHAQQHRCTGCCTRARMGVVCVSCSCHPAGSKSLPSGKSYALDRPFAPTRSPSPKELCQSTRVYNLAGSHMGIFPCWVSRGLDGARAGR